MTNELCLEEYPNTNINDWKRICKYKNKTYGTIQVFENKKENLYISIFEGDDGDDLYIWKSKLTNNPKDYVFGVGEDVMFGEMCAITYIQPKYGEEEYDQESILDFCLNNAKRFGFYEEDTKYSYTIDGFLCLNTKILKTKLIELGLEHDQIMDWGIF